ncbi:hypothetical protein MPSEU_000772800 [Mayamaea pseudoterrestris]|nr:hypothetical protein MPSEU_000772800 [Mayamaea pseudoterrestris]
MSPAEETNDNSIESGEKVDDSEVTNHHESGAGVNDEIRNLLALAKLSTDKLSSSEPPSSNVTKLNLTNCGLSKLPNNFDFAFPNLSILFLSNNHFNEMPAMIGRCRQLQMVAFKSNNMISIHPDSLQSQLRWLILTDNHISCIPSTICRCINLQKLMLSGNELTSLPEEAMAHCTKLELVRLASNQLQQPPALLLQSLVNLKWIALGDNPFLSQLYEQHENALEANMIAEDELDDSRQVILGSGAGGTTRKVYWTAKNEYVAVKSFESPHHHHDHVATATPVNSRTLRRMTSDGRPEHEALVFCAASACTSHHDPPTVVQVLGQTVGGGNIVMEYLHDNQALANPPSMESCTRDVYHDAPTLSLAQATKLVTRLLEAQVALHANGICHGDFYGHNVLIHQPSGNGSNDKDVIDVRLSDFGAAFFYNLSSDWGHSLQRCEVRAFGVLVQEVRALVQTQGLENDDETAVTTASTVTNVDNDLDDGGSRSDLLEQLADKCLGSAGESSSTTFDSISIWWKQQQLRNMAKDLHDELFN